ncbi:MAG: hypothetical protein BZ135_07965 [Methanosphaera sp. rholeuAM6]|jgi:hypothetical protein|nr:MAG: hypothetical protein BZ135_07965 [Methanosphaera sp. rholeuAM6]
MLLLIVFTITITLSSVNAGLFDLDSTNDDINVTDLEINYEGYSTYEVNCKLTPKKDFDYLEMFVIFYDSDDAVLDKSTLVWNTNQPTKDQVIKVSGTAYVQNDNEKPVRAEVYFTDGLDAEPESAIYSENVTMG